MTQNIEYNAITECRICKNSDLTLIFDLGVQFLSGIFPKNIKEDIYKAPLALVKCNDRTGCGHVQLSHSFNPLQMYGENYGYRSGLNQSMISHLKEKQKELLDYVNLRPGDLVIDIAGNDGTFLSSFSSDLNLLSIDPTAEKFKEFYPKHVKYISNFFDKKIVQNLYPSKKAKLVTCFSMFYDIENPIAFAKDIMEIIDKKDGIWALELSYMPEMVATNSFDTICHEHLSYFGLKQLKFVFDAADFKIVNFDFNKVNGGSISILVAHKNSNFKEAKIQVEKQISFERESGFEEQELWNLFSDRVLQCKNRFFEILKYESQNGNRIAALGASTKGNVLLQSWGITPKDIEFIGDVNPDKNNCITPGTHIQIYEEEMVLSQDFGALVILPWHFRDFFVNNMKFANKRLIFPLPFPEVVST